MAHASPFEQPPRTSQEIFSIDESNHIQMELIVMSGGDPMEWIETHSEAFREIIENEPHLHELYIKDSVACLEYIKKCLERPTHH